MMKYAQEKKVVWTTEEEKPQAIANVLRPKLPLTLIDSKFIRRT